MSDSPATQHEVSTSYGGLEHAFLDEIPDDLLCGICTKVFNIPHLTDCCGQHFCVSCLNHWFTTSPTRTRCCPFCRNSQFNHMQDKNFSRRVIELKVACTNSLHGCDWTGHLSDLEHHLEENTCRYQIINCPLNCGELYKRGDMYKHVRSDCKHRSVQCEHCGETSKHFELEDHLTVCSEFKVPCPKKCNRIIRRCDVRQHLSEECVNETVPCLFHNAGCDIRVERDSYQNHIQECKEKFIVKSHQNVMIELKSLKEEMLEVRTENVTLKSELTAVERGLNIISVKADTLTDENAQFKSVLMNELSFLHPPSKPCEIISLDCIKTHLKGQFLHLTSGGDTATFRLADYSSHKENDIVWYSPSFYFDNHGYQLCLAVHLNGVGAGKGTHVAVCLQQLVGQFDSDLTWPFFLNEKLEIRLMRQEPTKESKTAHLRAKVDSWSPQMRRKQNSGKDTAMSGYPNPGLSISLDSCELIEIPTSYDTSKSSDGLETPPPLVFKMSPRLHSKMMDTDHHGYSNVEEYQIISLSATLNRPLAATRVSHLVSKLELFCLQKTVANTVFLDSIVLQCRLIADH